MSCLSSVVRCPLGGLVSVCKTIKRLRGLENVKTAYIYKVVRSKWGRYQFWVNSPFKENKKYTLESMSARLQWNRNPMFAFYEHFSSPMLCVCCVAMALLCHRCVFGAAGAAGRLACWGGEGRGRVREGGAVMANIWGKKPLTHGTSNAGPWKIHLNARTAPHAPRERDDTSYINTQGHTWGGNTCGCKETLFLCVYSQRSQLQYWLAGCC